MISDKQLRGIGARIYDNALADRRGFRSDQIGIPDDDPVWAEIFDHIGKAAIEATTPAIRAAALEEAAVAMDDWPCRATAIRALKDTP